MTTVALTFINENGKKYKVYTDKVREDATLEHLGELMDEVSQIGASGPDGTDRWIGGAAPMFVENRPTRNKTNSAPRSKPSKPRAQAKKYWLVSPDRIINGNPVSLIKTLKKYYQEGVNPEVFVSNLLLVKSFWHADVFTLPQRIDPRDFYFEMKEIFAFKNEWTPEMLKALPQLSFIFSKEEWKRLHKEWVARRNALKKEMKELRAKKDPSELTADDILHLIADELDDDSVTSVAAAEKRTKSRPPKGKRSKIKKFIQSGGIPKKVQRTETVIFEADVDIEKPTLGDPAPIL